MHGGHEFITNSNKRGQKLLNLKKLIKIIIIASKYGCNE
jgi:hypothetical protein